ncbi:porin family protein [Niabella hibiscisoli]|uniref:porin family protein n=1 Tax=Niabella hibiscisoli TaxID=1825928 RepID=UPI001F0DB7BB|nr:porin family protein [Niabella hibiscisoli]MCH5715825.1 PorT family protein [Niabella hibiscisoli]
MKKIILSALLLATITTQAQTKFGIQAGAIGSNFKVKADGDENVKYRMTAGFKAGVFAEIPVSQNVFINPALNFVHKGGKAVTHIENEGGSGDLNVVTKTNYLEMPVNLMYKLNGADAQGFYFGAGPVLGMGLGGEIKTTARGTTSGGDPINESEGISIKFDGKNTSDDNAHFKRLEWGANAFAGYQLNNGLSFQLQYRPNFTNVSVEDNVSYKNNYFGFSIRYRF